MEGFLMLAVWATGENISANLRRLAAGGSANFDK
jgi:hypothetical protein